MTGEKPARQSELTAQMVALGIEIGSVVNSRRLVRISPDTEGRVEEVYSYAAASRLIAMPRDGEESRLHDDLSMHGLPVLPRQESSVETLDLLLIPLGTWPLGSRLHIVRRDFDAYSELLLEVARTQRRQYEEGLGFLKPTDYTRVVDHFAFTPNLHSPTGQQLFMVPPYINSHEITPEMFAENFARELAVSGEFDRQQMDYLYHSIRREVVGGGHE